MLVLLAWFTILTICDGLSLTARRRIQPETNAGDGRPSKDNKTIVLRRVEVGFDQEEIAPGWYRAREPGRPAYFVVHTPRTAGTSITLDLKKYLPDGYGLVSKESCYYDLRTEEGALPSDGTIVVLRDPVHHVYSQYVGCADDAWGQKVTADHREVFVNVSTWLERFTQAGASVPDVDDLGCYHPLNMQTRALSCKREKNEDPYFNSHHYHVASLYTALAVLSAPTTYVTMTELYQESLCVMLARITGKLPDFCNCQDESSWASFNSTNETHAVRAHAISDLTAENLQAIKNLTKKDGLLYAEGKKIFLRQLGQVEAEYNTVILCESQASI